MNQASRISSQEMHKRTTQFVLVVGLILMTFGLLGADRQAQAATSSYFNFQMRLLTSSGAVVADGNYHIEFKLYNAANSTGSSQGSCSGDANCLWTETRTTGNLVRVVNGYFSVQLGSVTALPSINWNQELWLGVRIGGSGGSPSWEANELTSDGTATGNKIALTAVPYAFTARELQMTSGSFTNTLLFATPSGSSKTITIPNETGTICTTGSVCTGYQASGSYYLQGGNSFGATAVLGTNDSNSLTFETNNTTQVTIAVGGATTFQNSTNSTTAFQIQNAAGTSLFNANTSTVVQLVNNNSMETSINGWVAKGSSTISSDNSVAAQFGSFYLKAATTAAIGDGAAYRVPLKASTQYSLSVWARLSSGSATTINFGRQDNAVDVDCLTGQTVNTTWTQFTCTFTTGATVNTTTNLYVKQTDATARNIYIDGLSLVEGATALIFNAGGNQIDFQGNSGNLNLNNSNTGELQAWQLNANALPAVRMYSGTAVANGYVYVIGGHNGTTKQSAVYYAKLNTDGSTGSWNTNANSLPDIRDGPSTVVANGYIYAIGGWNASSPPSTTVYYAKLNTDGSTGTWQTNANALPAARGAHSSIVANGYVYVIGGDDDTATQTTTYYAKLNADGSTGAWQTNAQNLANGRGYHSTAVANGYVYVIGGLSGGGIYAAVNTVYYAKLNADGTVGSWSSANALPANRFVHTSLVANGYVYVLAGQLNGTDRQTTTYYAKLNADGTVGSWNTNTNPLPYNRGSHMSVAANGYFYVIGGEDSTPTVQSTVYYASTSRILVGGSLDLVGLSGQNLAEGGDYSQGSTGGSLTAGNTQIVGSLQVQGQANFSQGVAILGNLSVQGSSYFNGDITIAKQADSGGTTADWSKVSQTTAGTIASGGTASIAGITATAVYNGSLYIGTIKTNAAEVYRYDGGTTWTRVSQSTAGTIASGGTASIDNVEAMAVYNGNLYIATNESNAAEVYRYDGGTTWIKVSQTTAGTIASGGTASIDAVASMAVYNNSLYVGISEGSDGAEVYRYDGGTTWTKVSQATAGTIASGGTTLIRGVWSMAVYNGGLYIGTSETAPPEKAEVYRYDGGTNWTRVSFGAGIIDNGGTANIQDVISMAVYNGRLYVGTGRGNIAEVYRYEIGTGWTKVSQSTAGTIASGDTASINFAAAMTVYNNKLYVGTNEPSSAEVYTYSAVEGQSYALKFGASSDEAGSTEQSGFPNQGQISFLAEQQALQGDGGGTGSFLFSHGIVTSFGAYDVAEDYPTRDESLKPGDLVSINPSETGFVKKTSAKHDSSILGIYSARPALRLSQQDRENIDGAQPIPVALAGRVKVNVTDDNGPIRPGDYLTSSSTPGYAMKATSAGPTIGKALEPLSAGSGQVLAFVNVSYYIPTVNIQGDDAILTDYLLISGLAKITNLEVTGNATIRGNIIVEGHIISAGNTPKTEVLASTTSANRPQITATGNDTAGTLKVTTIQSVQPGNLVKITFAKPFDKKPKIFLRPYNRSAVTTQIFREVRNDYFIIKLLSPLEADKTYIFDYFVVE